MDHVDLEVINDQLKQADAAEILRWAVATFGDRIAATSSFQTQSVPRLHLISKTVPQLPVLFIDTGYHFGDTLAFRDDLQERFNLNIVPVRPKRQVQRDRMGRPLYSTDPDLCCHHHKVALLDKVSNNTMPSLVAFAVIKPPTALPFKPSNEIKKASCAFTPYFLGPSANSGPMLINTNYRHTHSFPKDI